MIHEIYPKKLHIEYAVKTPKKTDTFLAVEDGCIYIKNEEAVSLPTVEEVECGRFSPAFGPNHRPEYTYLFSMDEEAFFTVRNASYENVSAEYKKVFAREMRFLLPKDRVYAALLGNQLCSWYEKNTYCGKCGRVMQHDEKERMMKCPSCGNFEYPQICPSVMVGVLSRDRMLITRYNPNHKMIDNGKIVEPPKTQSIVAGYIESGESAEEAVRREVMEEAGLKVKNIRYYNSAPWPVSGTLLLGYFCDVDGDDTIRREENELSEAVFLTREEVNPRPNDIGLIGDMIEAFRTGKDV